MKTKQEIISANLSQAMEYVGSSWVLGQMDAGRAMDEWAKEEGIGFLEWVRFKWKNTYNLLWEEIRDDFENTRIKDTSELYEMYLQEKKHP
jgi:hypothetical protein